MIHTIRIAYLENPRVQVPGGLHQYGKDDAGVAFERRHKGTGGCAISRAFREVAHPRRPQNRTAQLRGRCSNFHLDDVPLVHRLRSRLRK
jgi:hypothetical protein